MDGSFENQFVGLANYERTLQNSMFQLGLKNTWELSLLCAPVIWLLAFLLAAMLKTLKDRSTAFRNILLLPYLMPSSAMLLIWTLMFDYGGVINRMVTALGMERVLWLEVTHSACGCAIVHLEERRVLGCAVRVGAVGGASLAV